jgi:hypothetical protein
MSKLGLWRTICLVCVFCVTMAITSPAQTYKTLVSFNGTNGAYPYPMSLIQGTDGNFYGTTIQGGPVAPAFSAVARFSKSPQGAR